MLEQQSKLSKERNRRKSGAPSGSYRVCGEKSCVTIGTNSTEGRVEYPTLCRLSIRAISDMPNSDPPARNEACCSRLTSNGGCAAVWRGVTSHYRQGEAVWASDHACGPYQKAERKRSHDDAVRRQQVSDQSAPSRRGRGCAAAPTVLID